MNPIRAYKVPSLLRCAIFTGPLILLAPAAFAQEAPYEYLASSALCVAAGELVAAQPGADASITKNMLIWRQILHVMEGTEARRQLALDSVRAGWAQFTPRLARMGAQALVATCADREGQMRSILMLGSKDRVRYNLAEEPGTVLAPEVAQRLNHSALCLAAAELFLQPRPSRSLRAAFREASPPHPDTAALQAIRERSRQEIDGASVFEVGKELVADYSRFLINPANVNGDPQPSVNRASLVLQDRCQPVPGSGQPAP